MHPGSIGRYRQCWRSAIWICRSATCRYPLVQVHFWMRGNFEMVSFPESSIPDGAEFGVRVSGDSMEPVYHDGQIVWVQRCETLRTGEVGVMIYDGQGYIKAYAEQEPDDS